MIFLSVLLFLIQVCTRDEDSHLGADTVHSVVDFDQIRQNPFGQYVLDRDIDLSMLQKSWVPFDFHGSLDGNGHKISGLVIHGDQSNSPKGLFSRITGDSSDSCGASVHLRSQYRATCRSLAMAEVRNLRVEAQILDGRDRMGILAGEISHARLERITVKGVMKGGKYLGGVAGIAGPFVTAKYLNANVDINGHSDVGGVFGSVLWCNLQGAESHAKIQGTDRVGGVVGAAGSSYLMHMIFSGSLVGRDTVGGILGIMVGSNWGGFSLKKVDSNAVLPDEYGYTKERHKYYYGIDAENLKYQGYFYQGESDWPTMEYWNNLPKGNHDPYRADEVALDTRLSDGIFLGEVECRSVCGGIRGAGVAHSLALANVVASGLVKGKIQVGVISGTADDDMKQINILQSGVQLGHHPYQSFGASPQSIAWGIVMSPPVEKAFSREDIFPGRASRRLSFGKGSCDWREAFYPDGFLIPAWEAGKLKFWNLKNNGAVVNGLKSIFDSIHRFNDSQSFDDGSYLPIQFDATEEYWVKYFPPMLAGDLALHSSHGCLELGQFFDSTARPALDYALPQAPKGWNLSRDLLCPSQGQGFHDSVLVRARQRGRGQSLFWVSTKDIK